VIPARSPIIAVGVVEAARHQLIDDAAFPTRRWAFRHDSEWERVNGGGESRE